ncbi:MAG TPA: hypothetical protein VGD58_04345 [Herpetosiphonaceae bacterium]
METRLPQNIQTLVGEIGERQVLLRLAILCHKTPPWSVFHNLGEAGFDILLLNTQTNERIAIEVKTRQKLYTTGKHKNRIHFAMTNGEYSACDFLVAFFLDQNEFFVVPKTELKSVSQGKLWRFLVTTNNSGRSHPRFDRFRNAWHLLHVDFSDTSPDLEDLEPDIVV